MEMKANDIATNHVRCLKQWIIDSGAQVHVVRLGVAQLFLGILEPRRTVELRGAGGHELDFYGTGDSDDDVRSKVSLASRSCSCEKELVELGLPKGLLT